MSQSSIALALALLGSAVSGVCAPPRLSAQAATAVIVGTVRTETGRPLDGALISASGRLAGTDSLGRFRLTGLSGDTARVSVRRLGFSQLDTTIALHAGIPARLDVTLDEPDRGLREAEATDAAAGRVDSSALGLLRTGTSGGPPSLTFGGFGARLLAAAVREADPDANTVVSPVSAGLAVSLALHGARGSTAVALSKVLGTEALDRTALVQRGTSFIAAISGRRDVQLEIANAVWVDSAVALADGFTASASAWRAQVGTLRLDSPYAVESINRWADSVTHGKISRIFDEPLPDSSELVIANAVYFKGKWLDPFEKNATSPRDFTLASGQRIRVPAMSRTAHLAYQRGSAFQMVRLPYRGGRVAMYVILPDSGVTAVELTRRFADGGWPASLVARDMRHVHLVLPKLHVEQTLDLRSLLETLGAGIALDCDRADFRDLAVPRGGGTPRDLCITKAVQKVYLDVDEEGTEAAAVSALVWGVTASLPRPPLEFIVDRPFLFILRDEVTGADLFVGRIGRP